MVMMVIVTGLHFCSIKDLAKLFRENAPTLNGGLLSSPTPHLPPVVPVTLTCLRGKFCCLIKILSVLVFPLGKLLPTDASHPSSLSAPSYLEGLQCDAFSWNEQFWMDFTGHRVARLHWACRENVCRWELNQCQGIWTNDLSKGDSLP